MTIFVHELKMNRKSLLIWSCCIGVVNFGCLLLFESLADTMDQMSEAYAEMGSFSAALGLDRLSVSTMEGFYATEIALIFAVGGAMFAAMMGASMLSKEEEGHAAEFLYTLPLGRSYIVWRKYMAMAALIVLFQVLVIVWELLGFQLAGDMIPLKKYFLFHGAQLVMQSEVGSMGFVLSAVCRRKQIGAALGIAVLLYGADLLCRIVPKIENVKYITPFYYSNAVDIFVSGSIDGSLMGIGIGVAAAAGLSAWAIYGRRDLSV